MRNKGSGILLALVLFGLAAGLVAMARLSQSSSYPEFSSLNTGPSGTALLFETLAQSGKVKIARNFLPLDQLETHGATVLYLGIDARSLPSIDKRWLIALEKTARSANRLVLGIHPDRATTLPFLNENHGGKPAAPEIEKRWNVHLRRETTQGAATHLVVEPGREWQTRGDGIWERAFAAGSIVVLTGAGRLGNRSLAEDESARALVPLVVGSTGSVIFEESHLGMAETGSIAALAGRYHLAGLLAGLLLLAILFIWRSAVHFPPPPEDEERNDRALAANDGRQRMAALLERHVAAGSLIEACINEWNRVRPKQRLDAADWQRQNAVSAFAAIRQQLGRKRK